MPRPAALIPAYTLHRASGQAIVRLSGRDHYLGPHGTPESRQKYDRLMAEWLTQGRSTPPPQDSADTTGLLVSEVLLRFMEQLWPAPQTGKTPKEVANFRLVVRCVHNLYGDRPATTFGPLALKAVRTHMIEVQDLCRTEVNKRIGRIKRIFKWAVSEELIPSSIFEALRTVEGIRHGKSKAREKPPVKPVSDKDINSTLPFMNPLVATMVRVQRLTGMRPGELVIMRPCDIDQTADPWVYHPESHKTAHLGVQRSIPLGPQVQQLLQPFLDRPADKYLFSPAEAEANRHEERAKKRSPTRKTKIFPSELRARERRLKKSASRPRARPLGNFYDTCSYRRAITYAIKKALRQGVVIPHWHPHQLRHSRATEIRKMYGVEAAQVSLGHLRADVTEIYAERNFELASKVARECG